MRALLALTALLSFSPAFSQNQCLRAATNSVAVSEVIQQLKQKNAERRPEVPVSESEEYISRALEQIGLDSRYVEMVLSRLKDLNDNIFKDKVLVTALINLHKSYFFEEFRKMEFKSDDKVFRFSNFKAINLEFTDSQNTQGINQVFLKANELFFSDWRIQRLVEAYDIKETNNWFHMGVDGKTEGQTAAATRAAKELKRPVASYLDEDVQTLLSAKLKNVQNLHAELTSVFDGTDLLIQKDQKSKRLHFDFVSIIRKLPDGSLKEKTQALRLALSFSFPETIPLLTDNILGKMIDYARSADIYSASLLTTDQLQPLGNTPYGAIFIDFVALGAENLEATIDAILDARDVDHAIELSRIAEMKVTDSFNLRKKSIKDAMIHHFGDEDKVRFIISGDEFWIIPTTGERRIGPDTLYILGQLTRSYDRPYVRIAATPANTRQNDTTEQISYGEQFEKNLRKKILVSFGRHFTRKTHIAVLIYKPRHDGAPLALLPSVRVQQIVSKSERERLRTLIHDSVADLAKAHPQTTFNLAESYLIDDSNPLPQEK